MSRAEMRGVAAAMLATLTEKEASDLLAAVARVRGSPQFADAVRGLTSALEDEAKRARSSGVVTLSTDLCIRRSR